MGEPLATNADGPRAATSTAMTSSTPSNREPGADEFLVRFGLAMRLLHWAHTLAFLLLLGSGLALYFMPSAHAIMVGPHRLVPLFHALLGVALLPPLALVVVIGWRRGVSDDLREALRWDRGDLLRAMIIPLLLPDGRQRLEPKGKYASGQKLNTLATIVLTAAFPVTGIVLLINMLSINALPLSFVQFNLDLHDLLAFVGATLLAVHIYFAAFHPETRAALRGMVTGRVSGEWARRHYPTWAAKEARHGRTGRATDVEE